MKNICNKERSIKMNPKQKAVENVKSYLDKRVEKKQS